MNEVTRNKQKSTKLDHSTFIEVVKNSPLVSIDLIVRNAQNEVLLGYETMNQPRIIGSRLVVESTRMNE